MKKSIQKTMLYCAIEYHWCFVLAGRKRLSRLYERGFALSSPEMLRVNDRLSKHCCRITICTSRYKVLAGIR